MASKTKRSARFGLDNVLNADALISLRTAQMMLDTASSPLKHALVNIQQAWRETEKRPVADALDSLIRKLTRSVDREEYVRQHLGEMVKGVSAKDLVRHRIGEKAK